MKALKYLLLLVPLIFIFSFLPTRVAAEEPKMEPKVDVQMVEEKKDAPTMEECKVKIEEDKTDLEEK